MDPVSDDALDREVEFDLLSAAFQLDPPATFAALRERCPVHHTTRPVPHYSLSRQVDVLAALRDEETWSSKFGPGLAYGEVGAGVLVASAVAVVARGEDQVWLENYATAMEKAEQDRKDLLVTLVRLDL